jgi:hypothetical protein
MKTKTLCITPFVGTFNNRRVRTGANIGNIVVEKSEDGVKT